MELSEFKKILLNVAVCAIACDGDIDDREIEALHNIEKSSPYFSALDLSETLEGSLKACSEDLSSFQKNVFEMLDANTLNIVQELSVLEISWRIIAADGKEEKSEIAFINELRTHLDVEDFLINQRFGDISYLKPKKSEFKNFNEADENSISINSKD
jgi:uncharacterized tellurite resistance protein B-like protein